MSLRRAQPAEVVPLRLAEVSDAALVARALSGDARAEEAIFVRHLDAIGGLCMRLLRDREEARDVLQDTFLDVLEQLPTLREPEKLRSWITGIAVHKVHRRFRRRRLKSMLGLRSGNDEVIESLPGRPELSPEQHAQLRQVDLVLGRLPDADRACWLLRRVEGYRLEEVVRACRCSLATAKRRIARVDAVLRRETALEDVADD